MQPKSPMLLGLFALAAAASTVPVSAQPPPQHLMPQSIQVEQKETIGQLSALARRKGPIGVAAAKALVAYRQHAVREQEFIMPPLTLLPYLADGKVTPDMSWALAMTDRVRAEREEIFKEHERITEGLNALADAAAKAHDYDTKAFAETAAAGSLSDMEILEPTLLLIGDILKARLPAAH